MYARNLRMPDLITPQRDRSCGRFYGISEIHQKVATLKQPSFLSFHLQPLIFFGKLSPLTLEKENHPIAQLYNTSLSSQGQRFKKSEYLEREEAGC